MHYTEIQNRFLSHIRLFLISGIVVTIVLSWLNLNSTFIILLAVTWLTEGDFRNKLKLLKKDFLFLAYLAYVVLQFVGLFKSDNLYYGYKELESKLGFLVLPLVFCSTSVLSHAFRTKVMYVLSLTVTVVGLYCLVIAGFHFLFHEKNADVFFYHQLVSPVSHHAVYFSVFVFISLAFILFEILPVAGPRMRRTLPFWIGFLLVLLFLLSSKMVLLVLVFLLIYFSFELGKKKINKPIALISVIALVIIILSILFTDNQVRNRFSDMKGNISKLSLEKYNEGFYFNPWEFRLLLWRITFETVDEQEAWLTGVGPVNDQRILQAKYRELGLYSGDLRRNDPGYFNFNCHNQFLQSTLESGIPGLLSVIFFCCMLFQRTRAQKRKVLSWVTIIVFCFFFTESVFERQYGMVLTTLFPLMYLYSTDRTEKLKT